MIKSRIELIMLMKWIVRFFLKIELYCNIIMLLYYLGLVKLEYKIMCCLIVIIVLNNYVNVKYDRDDLIGIYK